MRRLPLLLLTLLALAGCDDQPSTQAIPEISDANCTLEVINQIQDRTARAVFQTLGGYPAHRATEELARTEQFAGVTI